MIDHALAGHHYASAMASMLVGDPEIVKRARDPPLFVLIDEVIERSADREGFSDPGIIAHVISSLCWT
jgi:hypothetical protein